MSNANLNVFRDKGRSDNHLTCSRQHLDKANNHDVILTDTFEQLSAFLPELLIAIGFVSLKVFFYR
jgi:hypothetical protein